MDENDKTTNDNWTADDERRLERLHHIGDLGFAARTAQQMKAAGFADDAIRREMDAMFPEASGLFRGLSLETEKALTGVVEKSRFDLDTEDGRTELVKAAAQGMAPTPEQSFVKFADTYSDTLNWIYCAPRKHAPEQHTKPVEKAWHQMNVRERCEATFTKLAKQIQEGTTLTFNQAYCEVFKREDAAKLYELYRDPDSGLMLNEFVTRKDQQGDIDAVYVAKKLLIVGVR